MDLAGIGHASIFWGFLSFSLSYLIFIFGGVIWSPLPETVLTETGVRVFSIYLDIFALVILLALVWALFRRWLARPHRLRFDLTRKGESVIIVGLTGGLMIATLLVHAFYVAEGGAGPEAEIFIGGALGRWFVSMGLSASASASLQTISWWVHLGIILGFGVYIPFSKHIHMVAAPLNAYFRSLEPRGTLATRTARYIPSFHVRAEHHLQMQGGSPRLMVRQGSPRAGAWAVRPKPVEGRTGYFQSRTLGDILR